MRSSIRPPDRDRATFAGTCRGVSPVVGAVLMVAIVVTLAGAFATMATGFGSELEKPQPTAGFEADWQLDGEGNSDRPFFRIVHESGESFSGKDVYITDEDGNRVMWDEVWTGNTEVNASEFAHIDGYGSDSALTRVCTHDEGYTYRLVEETSSGSRVLDTYELPRDPGACP